MTENAALSPAGVIPFGISAEEFIPYPSDACIHQLVEQQVGKNPDATAVVFNGSSWSYRELNERANILAHRLREVGAGPDKVVGIYLHRSPAMVLAVLAVLKSGAAYLPLDPTYPHERLQFMLEDSGALVLLTEESLSHVFPSHPQQMMLMEREIDRSGNSSNPVNLTMPDQLAYLIYTSGSTGKPKGVAMHHRPLVNLIDWQCKDSGMGVGDRTVQFTSLSFDVSFQEIFSTWCSGGVLVLITEEVRFNPRDLLEFIEQQRIARLFLPFVALQQLADVAQDTVPDSLREVITAGEQLQITPRIRSLFSRLDRCSLHNHYGPSETHVVTALTLIGDPLQWPALPPIGRAIQNTWMRILTEQGERAADGESGELYIGGLALARGYFNRPDVTAERFIPDAFASDPGERLYKTGDLTQVLPDGNIQFQGRIDHQVKIRGYRIELGEIEAWLGAHPKVGECVVVARETQAGDVQLVAHVVGAAEQSAVGELKDHLREKLPEYMVPAAFSFLRRFPLTPSGKIDRRSLPEPDVIIAADHVGRSAALWSSVEFQLAQIWEKLLNVRPIGIQDNFFELGGHSLLAVRLMDRIEEATGRRLPVTALFEDATIARLAQLLCQAERPGAAAPLIQIQKGDAGIPFYFLHGDLFGGGFYTRDLARELGTGQPFYVMSPLPLNESRVPSVEQMAREHVKILQQHQAHGPYLLGGFCVGALVAYEMARLLRDQGEDVPWVALLDPDLHSRWMQGVHRLIERIGNHREWTDDRKAARFINWHLRTIELKEAWHGSWSDLVEFALPLVKRLFRKLNRGPSVPASTNDQSAPARDLLVMYDWITAAYSPPPSSGPSAIVFSEEQLTQKPFLLEQWKRTVTAGDVYSLPGRHTEFITRGVGALAEKLRESLRVATGGGSASRGVVPGGRRHAA